MGDHECSAFYQSVCAGDLAVVEKHLSTMRAHEITRLEPNGTTALHAAAIHGHEEILKLLISRRCLRSVRNNSNKTAYEEATTPTIRSLLVRSRETRRYEAETIAVEWISDNFDGIWRNMLNPGRLFECPGDSEEKIRARQDCINKWLEQTILKSDDKDTIMCLFNESFTSNSAEFLLQAYTEEASFYSLLNNELAKIPTDDEQAQPELHPALIFARTIFRCAYYGRHTQNSTDILYRAANYNEKEIQKYKDHIGKGAFKTKTLWSTSKSREKASQVVSYKYNVMLVLKSRDASCRRTLELSSLSAYPAEEEVLIVPLTCMQVTNIETINDGKYEIHLMYWDW